MHKFQLLNHNEVKEWLSDIFMMKLKCGCQIFMIVLPKIEGLNKILAKTKISLWTANRSLCGRLIAKSLKICVPRIVLSFLT